MIYVVFGYLIIISILVGVLNHRNMKADTFMLIAITWPFIVVVLPLIAIAVITKRILDRVYRNNRL